MPVAGAVVAVDGGQVVILESVLLEERVRRSPPRILQ